MRAQRNMGPRGSTGSTPRIGWNGLEWPERLCETTTCKGAGDAKASEKVPNSKFSAFALSFGATAAKRSEDGQVPKKAEIPSSKGRWGAGEFSINPILFPSVFHAPFLPSFWGCYSMGVNGSRESSQG
jgi:hypothetical protein